MCQTGNSKVRFNMEKMPGTHICSERGTRVHSTGSGEKFPEPGGPRGGHLPLLPAPSPGSDQGPGARDNSARAETSFVKR